MRPMPLHQRFTPKPLTLAAAMAIPLAAGHAPLTHAQSGTAAAAATPIAINIPAQPLGQALNELARQANLQMTFPAALVAGKQAPAVSGQLTARQALDRILAGSGLTATLTGSNVVVREAPTPKTGEATLPAVTVTAGAEPPAPITGPTAGPTTTATRIAVDTRYVPQSVAVAGTDLLSEIGARSVADAAPLISGVTRDVDVGRSSLTVRGFEAADLTLVDGLRAANTGGAQFSFGFNDLALYDRVEVLKGHSSLLYGQGIPGGSINFVAKKPLFERLSSVELTGSTDNYTRGVLDLTGPISDTLAYRIVAVAQNDDSLPERNAMDDRRIFSASLLWKAPTGGELLARYERTERDFIWSADAQLINNVITPYVTNDPRRIPEEFRTDSLRLSFNQPLGNAWKLALDAAYANQDHLQQSVSFFPDSSVNPTSSIGNYFRQNRTDKGYALRAEAHGDLRWGATRHRLILGTERYQQDRAIFRTHNADFAPGPVFAPNFGAPLPSPLATPQRFGTDASEHAYYLTDYVDFGERWHALFGLRHTSFERKNSVSGATQADSRSTDPTLGLVYDVSPSLSLYASASRSFAVNGGQSVNGDFFGPRRGTNKEIGLKGDALNKRVHYTAAAFEVVQDNITNSDPNNPGFSILTGEVTVKGLEFDVSAELTNRLTLIGALTLMDAEITKNTEGRQGNTPANSPRVTGALRASYRADGGLRFGGTLSHVGKRQVSEFDQIDVPSYTRLDLDASWRVTPRWTLSAALENVFDKDYIASARFASQIQTGRPRTLTLNAKYDF